MNWRRMLLAGALVGGSIWCLGLVKQVHSQQIGTPGVVPVLQSPSEVPETIAEADKTVSRKPAVPG